MISFEGRRLEFADTVVEVEFPIQEAREYGELVVVLFRPESFKGAGQFNNLVAYDRQGSRLWEAELPTASGVDAYYRLLPGPGLIANSYSSHRCEIELSSGRLISKVFYK